MIFDLERRLRRIAERLGELSLGNYGLDVELEAGDDVLGEVEQSINGLMMDLQTLDMANQEKAALVELQTAELSSRSAQLRAQQEELELKLATIEEQATAIRRLGTPVLEVWHDVLAMPLVGLIDSERCEEIMTTLLGELVARKTRCVIIDVTGVDVLDTQIADALVKIVRATGLLGVRCTLTGVRPNVAHTVVQLGADMREVRTLRTLREGLKDAMAYLAGTIR